ncbi:MAG: MBL fold metallo-hydrolase, partial [Candidatus Hodarchaeales archaeon]
MPNQSIFHEDNEIVEWRWAFGDNRNHPLFWTSCYYIDGILIDSGAPAGIQEFREFVLSLSRKKVDTCIVSHTHEDHSGGLSLLNEEFNIPIFASQKAISILKNGFTYPEYRKAVWGLHVDPVEALPFFSSTISSKTEKFTFNILPMPGHAPEQVTFVEKEKEWAFVTDSVQIKYKRIFGGNSSIQEDISTIYNSILKLYRFTEGMDDLKVFLQGREVVNRDFLSDKLREIKEL